MHSGIHEGGEKESFSNSLPPTPSLTTLPTSLVLILGELSLCSRHCAKLSPFVKQPSKAGITILPTLQISFLITCLGSHKP